MSAKQKRQNERRKKLAKYKQKTKVGSKGSLSPAHGGPDDGRPSGAGGSGGGSGSGGGKPRPTGQATPVIDPFMTAEDMLADSQANAEYNNTLADLDAELARMAADNAYQNQMIDRDATYSKRDTEFAAAGRGMQHSSIRDADLYDIDATAGVRKSLLETELNTATLDAQRQKVAAREALEAWRASLQQKMVENAQEASAGMPEWLVEPAGTQQLQPNKPGGGKPNKPGGGKPNKPGGGKPNKPHEMKPTGGIRYRGITGG